MAKSIREFYRYLVVDPRDRAWGLNVTGAGFQPAAPGFDKVPRRRHPAGHYYVWERGRVLSEYALVVVGEGRGQFDSRATGLVEVNAGDAIVLVPGSWHRYRPDKASGWRSYWVHFQGDVADRLQSGGELSPERPVVRGGADEHVIQGCAMIVDALRSEAPGFTQVAGARTLEILARLVGAAGADRSPPRVHDTVRRVRRLLEATDSGSASVDALIERFRVSRTHFFRVFKEQTGQTPHQYRLQLIIRRAGEMLRSSALSVKQVSESLGFESPYHFSRVFKQKTGFAPRDYRLHWQRTSRA